MMFYRGTGSDNQDCAGTGTAYELAAMLIYVCDQQVSFGQIMFSPPQQNFSCTPMSVYYGTSCQIDCLIKVKTIKNNTFGPRKR